MNKLLLAGESDAIVCGRVWKQTPTLNDICQKTIVQMFLLSG